MLALVFPFQAEMNAFLSSMETVALKEQAFGTLRTFALQGRPHLRLAVCGQGKVEAALACQILAQALSPSAYLLLGSASALDPSLKVGDLVLADPCIEVDFRSGPASSGVPGRSGPDQHPTFRPRHVLPITGKEDENPIRTGTILSADHDVFDTEEKLALLRAYGALATAWEGAGFHRFLRRNLSKGWEIRLITETSGEGRVSLEDLHRRMRGGFKALQPLIQGLE